MFPVDVVVRNVEIVELRAVVVAHESRALLEVLGLEFDDGRCAVAVRLLPSRDERLLEQAADRFAAEETEAAWTRRKREEFVRPRRAEPLKVDWQHRMIEILAHWLGRERVRRQVKP